MPEISDWNTAAASNNSAPPDGWPESMNYAQVNDAGREMMAVVARHYKDTNGTLNSTGSANAYALSPNRTVTYTAGLEFQFEANHTNTGASTLNVSALGAKNIKRTDGEDLGPGEIVSGAICRVVYDGTQFQLVGATPTSHLKLSGSTAVTLAEANPVLMLGSLTGANLAFDTNSIQGRNNGAQAAVDINALGGNVRVGPQSGTGSVSQYYAGGKSTETTSVGLDVFDTTANEPILRLGNSAGTPLAQFIHTSGDALKLRSSDDGAEVKLQGQDSGSTLRDMFTGDPDGASSLHYTGTASFRSADRTSEAFGAQILDGGGNWRPAGMGIEVSENQSSNFDLRITNVGYRLRMIAAVDADIDTTTDTAPDGSRWTITNFSGGNRSITATGVTLTWTDGAGGQTGTRTLANRGIARVYKRANGQYEVDGVGIS